MEVHNIDYHRYTVVMLSGGLDSTYTAYKMLRDTEDIIHLHHCEQRKGNIDTQWKVETNQIPKIIDWLKGEFPKRHIQFSSSKFEYDNAYWSGWDTTHFTIFSIDVARSIFAKDIGAQVSIALGIEDRLKKDGLLESREAEFEAVFNVITNRMMTKPKWITPILHMNKYDIILDIPKELKDLTWSCRSPQRVGDEYLTCGRCGACQERAVIEGRLTKDYLGCQAGGI